MIRLRHAAMARYALLPFWYTVFREAGVTGMPVMRTMWMQYPKTEALFATDDQYLIGADLLVKPVTAAGVTESTVLFPADDRWYDIESFDLISKERAAHSVATVTVPSDIDKIPVFQRGGSVIPRKLRLRRSSRLMTSDPYTLYVALDRDMKASGTLYMDDEETFSHDRKGEFAETTFKIDFKAGTISSSVVVGPGWEAIAADLARDKLIERIVVMGVDKAPTKATLDGESIVFDYDKSSKVVVLRRPNVSALNAWQINIA
jgi:alpha 1,3-glucosidase